MEELRALQLKYEALYQENFAKRRGILTGETPVAGAEDAPKGITGFWYRALANHMQTSQFIESQDVEALKALVDVRSVMRPGNDGFTLEFEFAENPFFTNKVLSKSFVVPNMLDGPDAEEEVEKIEGCDINWKEGKKLTVKLVKKKSKGKGRKGGVKEEDVPSFFRFFDNTEMLSEETDPEEVSTSCPPRRCHYAAAVCPAPCAATVDPLHLELSPHEELHTVHGFPSTLSVTSQQYTMPINYADTDGLGCRARRGRQQRSFASHTVACVLDRLFADRLFRFIATVHLRRPWSCTTRSRASWALPSWSGSALSPTQ